MAFHYKLETLLRVRRTVEEQAQQKLAHELYVLENHKKYLTELQSRRHDLQDTFEKRKANVITAAMFSFYVEFAANIERQIEFQRRAINVQISLVTEARNELAEKIKSRKVVERLKEKDFLVYTQDMLNKEQQENDEMAVLRFGREKVL